MSFTYRGLKATNTRHIVTGDEIDRQIQRLQQQTPRIAIIDKGQLVATGTKDGLKSMIQTGETIRVEVPEMTSEVLFGLEKLSHIISVEYNDGLVTIKCSGGRHNVLHVLEYLNNTETSFGRVFAEQPTLNDVFLEITGKELRDEVQ